MSRTLAVTTGLIILVSGFCLYAARGTAIAKPVWQVGDSWRVTVPVLAQRPGFEPVKISEETIRVRVREQAKAGRLDCYVLQVDSEGEAPGLTPHPNRAAPSSIWAYYTVSDLRLVRIEYRSADKEARLLDRQSAPRGEQIAATIGSGAPIPLLLPAFPLVPGRSAVLDQGEISDHDTIEREKKGEDVMKSSSLEADSEGASAAERARAGQGAVTVRFRDVVMRSRSGKSESVVMEQVWVPGRPWWSSARVFRGPADREGMELTTAW